MMYHVTFLLFALLPATDATPANPSVVEIEKAVLAARRTIRRGKVSLEANISGRNGKRDNDRFTTLWFDFDKDKVRSDVVNHSKNRDEQSCRHIECRNCERPNYYVDYWEMQLADGQMAVTLRPLTSGPTNPVILSEIFDPRLLGLTAGQSTILHSFNLESVLGRPDREKLELRRDRWKDADCWVISFRNLAGVYFEIWVVPSQGYSVVRSLTEASPGGKRCRQTVETEAGPVGKSGLWFPRTCIFEDQWDGQVVEKEVLRVTEVSLNEPVDEKVFTLAGMNIAPDTTIAGELLNGQPQAWTWTGEAVVPHVNPTFVPKQPRSNSRTWLTVIAVACAALATLALALYWRRGRLKASAA